MNVTNGSLSEVSKASLYDQREMDFEAGEVMRGDSDIALERSFVAARFAIWLIWLTCREKRS